MKTMRFGLIILFGIALALAAGGKATFDNLNLAGVGTGREPGVSSAGSGDIRADASGLTPELDHFDISLSLPGTGNVIVNTPLQITVTAKDSSDNTATDYSGVNTLTLNIYPHTDISPSSVTLANGVWQGNVTITVAAYGVVIRTSGGGKAGQSNAFDVLFPGPYSTVSGQATYNGQPFVTTSHVEFSLHDYGTHQRYPMPPSCYNSADGTFSIPNVRTGTYAISLKTDADTPPNFLPFPGDIWGGSSQFTVAAPTPSTQNFPVDRIIHLTSPANNAPPGIPNTPPYPVHQSPLTFAWDPIPEAANYNIDIYRFQDDPHQSLEVIYRESGFAATEKTIGLPANVPNQHYEFRVFARNSNNDFVGVLSVTLLNPDGSVYGFGSDYRFKVAAPVALDHFDISLCPAGTKIINTPFQVTIRARHLGETLTDYVGLNTLSLNIYPYTNITPSNVTLTNGVWQGDVTITAAGYGVVIRSSGDGKTGQSDPFDVLYPGPYATVSGQVLYNGQPFVTSSHVDFSMHDYGAGQRYPIPPSCYDPAHGTFSIPNVRTGTYALFLKTDKDTPPNYLPYPGDFWGGSSQFTVAAPTPTTQKFDVCQIIHLTSPANNAPPGIRLTPPYPLLRSPIIFTWDRIREAATYSIEIRKVQDDPYQDLELAYSQSGLTATTKRISLHISAANQHYELRIFALNRFNRRVGDFYVTLVKPDGGIYGHGTTYRFKVRF